jgi:hypothetical protein
MLRKTKALENLHSNGFSLNPEIIRDIFQFARPLGHAENPENHNMGFGFLYYGLVRALRPKHVLVIGSGYGFSVVCLAMGLKDNERGRLTFVDPSYNLLKHGPFKTVGGRGKWDDPEGVRNHFSRFGVHRFVNHHRMTAEELFGQYEVLGLPHIDLAFLDGNHSFKNVRHDFVETVKRARKNAYVLLHDTNIYIREMVKHSGVRRWLRFIGTKSEYFEFVDFPFSSGVAIVRILQDGAGRCIL